MRQMRRHFSPGAQAAIRRGHLRDGTPIPGLSVQHRFHPTQFCGWPKEFFGAVQQRLPRTPPGRLRRSQAKTRSWPRSWMSTCGNKLPVPPLRRGWVTPAPRDAIVNLVRLWSGRSGLPVKHLCG